MKICMIGDYSPNQDEGFKNIAFYLTNELSKRYELLNLDTKKVFSPRFWIDIKKFNPKIIHYVPGRTIKSFMILKALAYFNNAKTIMSAFHPEIASVPKSAITLLNPDLILTQSNEIKDRFNNLGCRIKFLPNGADTEKFIPISQKDKEKLREKYGIDKEKFVILHVGHLIKVRNLQIFNRMQGGDNQVIIIVSSHRKMNSKLYESLKTSGCIIWRGNFKNIEEIYALSDCYVFPVLEGYSISMPLSVLEAMACNLPVITTKFEGLTTFFNEGEGLVFAEHEEELLSLIDYIKKGNTGVKNRDKVLPYSWENIGKRLVRIYEEMTS